MTTESERDLKGYGRRRPFADWPGGSRVAVNFVLNYEEGGERNVADATPTPKIISCRTSSDWRRYRAVAAMSRTSLNTAAAPDSGAQCGYS